MVRLTRLGAFGARTLAIGLLALVVTAGGLGLPGAANAKTPRVEVATVDMTAGGSLMGCQSSNFTLWYGPLSTQSWKCSGIYTVNRRVEYFASDGWSGVITYNGTATWAFCDGEHGDLFSLYVNKINLYATRAPWC